MVELEDTIALGAIGASLGGSNPLPPTVLLRFISGGKMRLFIMVLLIPVSILMFFGITLFTTEKKLGFAQIETEGKINKNQPISAGELIYEGRWKAGLTEDAVALSAVMPATNNISLGRRYIYLGVENNSIKIEYKDVEYNLKEIIPEKRENVRQSFVITEPLNTEKQALLRVFDYISPDMVLNEKLLLITVVDEMNRITVKNITIEEKTN